MRKLQAWIHTVVIYASLVTIVLALYAEPLAKCFVGSCH
jgi:hypothetical protein